MTTKEKITLSTEGYCQRLLEEEKPRCKEQCYFCSEYQKDPDE